MVAQGRPVGGTGDPPHFGLFLPQVRLGYRDIEAQVRLAESLGFHSVWFIDHLAAPAGPEYDTLEGWTVASALATRTSRIRLGHLVLAASFRHPAVLAKMAATLDVVSDGRLELGLGWGSMETELAAFGFGQESARTRATRLVDTLEILERMFSGVEFSYEGHHHRLEGAIGRPVPVQERIPVHIGGAGRRYTLPIAARFGDWWNCPSYAVDDLAQLLPLAGSARVSVQHPVGLAATRSEVRGVGAEAERRFGPWGGLIVGTPREVSEALLAEQEMGVEMFIIQFSDFGSERTLRLFCREVVPAVRAAA